MREVWFEVMHLGIIEIEVLIFLILEPFTLPKIM